jgi:hypothetical protein
VLQAQPVPQEPQALLVLVASRAWLAAQDYKEIQGLPVLKAKQEVLVFKGLLAAPG